MVEEKQRVKTGIRGFDELVEGGFPKGKTILFSGTPGTGKTIFGLEYLYRGALQFKEKGMYVTFEETSEEIKQQALQFGWDMEKLEKQKLVKLMGISAKKINMDTAHMIIDICKKEKIKRLVIDSLSTLSINAPIYSVRDSLDIKEVMDDNVFFSPPIVGDLLVKRFIYNFIDDLKEIPDTTKMLISEARSEEHMSRDSLSEFLADGVVLITFESLGGAYSRSLLVRKMRQTKNDEDIHPLEISKDGLVVHSLEEGNK